MTRPRQLLLPLPPRMSLLRDDYFVSTSNRAALEKTETWPAWPNGMLAVVGPEGSGKTHLASVHRARVKAAGEAVVAWPDIEAPHLIVEDLDRIVGDRQAEVQLFHAFNLRAETGGSILFTARVPAGGWQVGLPDLRTRLNTVAVVDLPPPDDALLFAVLLKLFADRQISPDVAADISEWLVRRIDRSLDAAAWIVAQLDERSLSEGRRIDTRLAADILNAPDVEGQHS